MLIGRRCGTFLLRFSETSIEQSQKSEICGCLTVAFVEMDPVAGESSLSSTLELFEKIWNIFALSRPPTTRCGIL